jgi:uncharacterized protein YcgI (DUF1989 family)
VRCIDVEGGQCGDLFAFVDGDVREYHSAEHTRVHVNRLFPQVGEQFVTNRRRPILTFLEDTSPGRHDMLIAACDPTRFAGLGVEGWHPSCQENLEQAMAGFGFTQIEIPSPINLFTNLPVGADGTLRWDPSVSGAGNHVTLRAELDCYIVLTACAQDILPINHKNPTSLALEILE